MTELDKSTWPKLPSGAIDWETVFEDPVNGLIPLISQAHTATALRTMTVLVIKKLYARKDDPSEVERFVVQLNTMLPDDIPDQALPRVLEAVIGILRKIKDERIRIADAYSKEKALKQKAKGGDTNDEASADQMERRLRRREHELEYEQEQKDKNLRIIKYIVIAFGIIVIGAAAYFLFKEKSPPSSQDIKLQFIEQMKGAAVNEPPDTHIFGGKLRIGVNAERKFVTALSVPADACQSAAWVLLNRGTIVINGVLPSRISPGILKKLCEKRGKYASITWFPKKPKKAE